MMTLVIILKALAEIAGFALIGQGVLYVLAGAGREQIAIFELPVRDEPPAYARSFCKRCGCSVPLPDPRGPWTEIPAGLLDGDPGLRVDRHIFVEHRPAWTPRGDRLPELDERALRALRASAGPR